MVRDRCDAAHAILQNINLPVVSVPICNSNKVLVDGGLDPVRYAEGVSASGVTCFGLTARFYPASGNRRRQHGHSPSYPRRSAEKAVVCGIVMIALNASGAR